MKTQIQYADPLPADSLCDCGHPQDDGHPATVGGKTVQGWKWAFSLDGKRRLCHACQCAQTLDCGHAIGEHSPITSGYAVLPDGSHICYSCADKRQIEDLKDRSRPFCAYVGKGVITTWTGGKLMTITHSRPCALTRQSFTHDRKSYMSVHAVDVHGGHWAGRGSEGIAIKLRPVKG